MEERRVTQRIPYRVPCQVVASGEEYTASTVNLSLGGALLATPESDALPVDAELVLDVVDGIESHAIAVRVAHRTEALVGVEFQAMTAEAMQFVRNVVRHNAGPDYEGQKELASYLESLRQRESDN